MASFSIFIPGKRGANPQHLKDCGLDSLLVDGAPVMADVLQHGPDGGEGVLCTWDDPLDPDKNQSPGVNLQRQTWKKSPEGNYWIGWETERPVRPTDIQRKKIYQGCEVVLHDGNSWLVPTARQLPHILGIGEPRIDKKYKPFFDKARANLDSWLRLTETNEAQWYITPKHAGFLFCCEALALNYRITPAIADCLEIVSTDEMFAVIEAITDGWWLPHAIEQLQKKTQSEAIQSSTTSDSGAPA